MAERKLCQVAPWGGRETERWIRLGFNEHTETSRFILLVNRSPTPSSLVRQSDSRTEEKRDYYKEACEMFDKLKAESDVLPKSRRMKLDMFVVNERLSFYDLMYSFRTLFKELDDEKYNIVINITNGLFSWQMASYYAAMDSSNVIRAFAIEKDTGDITDFWLHKEITSNERIVINILHEQGTATLTELQSQYAKEMGKGNLTFISRIIQKMNEKNLVEVERSGRELRIKLTNIGNSYHKTAKIQNIPNVELRGVEK